MGIRINVKKNSINKQRRISSETATKYLTMLENSLSGFPAFPATLRELIITTFMAGFSSGVRYIVTGDEKIPLDRKDYL